MQYLIERYFEITKAVRIIQEEILDKIGYCIIHLPKTKTPKDGVPYKPIWHGECKYCNRPIKCNEFGIWY
jgi:hypothetical protein